MKLLDNDKLHMWLTRVCFHPAEKAHMKVLDKFESYGYFDRKGY